MDREHVLNSIRTGVNAIRTAPTIGEKESLISNLKQFWLSQIALEPEIALEWSNINSGIASLICCHRVYKEGGEYADYIWTTALQFLDDIINYENPLLNKD